MLVSGFCFVFVVALLFLVALLLVALLVLLLCLFEELITVFHYLTEPCLFDQFLLRVPKRCARTVRVASSQAVLSDLKHCRFYESSS